ncbi:hypothetical protein OG897_35425 [Streptomyces sp. NBC_00237]|uniref:hypothetical protein n=1 Tax=Streptomyces sp. NBC_00237 TaxID=2975687 RepID=UPI00224DCB0E|nr:hypothetical protein [Streptomyces sp. NBC_00237]MCX5206682.1 hypothetical protein [Streptomyces sp. NBC_00237]
MTTDHHGSGTWLRPEFVGREDELIHLSSAAKLVGVTRSAVSNWAARHKDFPKVALLTGPRLKPVKFIPRTEFLVFAVMQLGTPRQYGPPAGQPRTPPRPRAEIRAAQIEHHQQQVERLTALRAVQAKRVAHTTKKLKAAKARLEEAKAGLAAEVEAVQSAVARGLHD